MRRIIALLFYIPAVACSAFAQQKSPTIPGLAKYDTSAVRKIAYLHKLTRYVPQYKNSPLFIITFNSKTYHFKSPHVLSLLNVQEIVDMEIFKGKKADSLYSGTGKKGLIVIKVKNDIPVLSKAELLEQYNIRQEYKRLPVYIDSVIVDKHEQLFVKTKIKSITVAVDKETHQKYISIITNNIRFEPDPNAVYIRGLAHAGK